jgi:hypothetical protein
VGVAELGFIGIIPIVPAAARASGRDRDDDLNLVFLSE